MSNRTGLPKILLLEDAKDSALLIQSLMNKIAQITVATSVKEAEECLLNGKFDLLLFDVLLPDGTCFDVLQWLERSQNASHKTPFVLFTGKENDETIVKAFGSGALDYFSKPLRPIEFQMKMSAHFARLEKSNPRTEMSFGDLHLDLTTGTLKIRQGGQSTEVELTRIEYDILRLLMSRPDSIRSRQEILDWVWKNKSVNVTERTVDVHVCNLRSKMKASEVKIASKTGFGYHLTAKAS